ncbi:MAG TPA: response regulator [Candidatus Angelobacter sp.]|nr:response regulator [Candidatus Angelobacter sp.]
MSSTPMSSTPTVYFIDDSATMREVIKIAFRRENINVVACQDAATALAEIERARPNVVITDVIMPGKDGYEVCQFIKSHPTLSKTPVVLMSGVVNRSVAERAFAVKADELLRKPFQPQDLITRVRHLLNPSGAAAPPPPTANATAALSNIFSSAASAPPKLVPTAAVSAPRAVPVTAAAAAPAIAPVAVAPPVAAPVAVAPPPVTSVPAPIVPAPVAVAPAIAAAASAKAAPLSNDAAKLKVEVMRLEGLVKKLQSELLAEREYSQALEAHVKTLQEAD